MKAVKIILCIGGIVFSIIFIGHYKKEKDIAIIEHEIIEKQNFIYENCLNQPYQNSLVHTLFKKLSLANNVAIYFEDLNNEYTLTYNANRTYYAASVTKLFVASFLIDSAKNGVIDLQDTLTYTNEYRSIAGDCLEIHQIGDEITMYDLITYSITVSDNGAYKMLIDNISIDNFQEYAKNALDVDINITYDHPYAYLNVTDTNKLLNHIYKLILDDDTYSDLLLNSMNNTYENALNFDDTTFLHKFGYYASYFNDIGIYKSSSPYLISIFTLYGNEDGSYIEKISNISREIYNIYQFNLTEKENYCYSLAYE